MSIRPNVLFLTRTSANRPTVATTGAAKPNSGTLVGVEGALEPIGAGVKEVVGMMLNPLAELVAQDRSIPDWESHVS